MCFAGPDPGSHHFPGPDLLQFRQTFAEQGIPDALAPLVRQHLDYQAVPARANHVAVLVGLSTGDDAPLFFNHPSFPSQET